MSEIEDFPCLHVKICNKCGKEKNATVHFRRGKCHTCKECRRLASQKRKKILWKDGADKWNYKRRFNVGIKDAPS